MQVSNTDTVFPRIIAGGDYSREASLESPGNCSGPKCGSCKANQSILVDN